MDRRERPVRPSDQAPATQPLTRASGFNNLGERVAEADRTDHGAGDPVTCAALLTRRDGYSAAAYPDRGEPSR